MPAPGILPQAEHPLPPGRAKERAGRGWQCRAASASPSDASVHIPVSPAGSAHGGWCGSWFPARRQGDGTQEPKGKHTSSRVFAVLLWREPGGMWVPAPGSAIKKGN